MKSHHENHHHPKLQLHFSLLAGPSTWSSFYLSLEKYTDGFLATSSGMLNPITHCLRVANNMKICFSGTNITLQHIVLCISARCPDLPTTLCLVLKWNLSLSLPSMLAPSSLAKLSRNPFYSTDRRSITLSDKASLFPAPLCFY